MIKVIATHIVDANNPYEAEELVENGLSEPDIIESKPVSHNPRDYIAYGLSNILFHEHKKIIYEEDYDNRRKILEEKVKNYLSEIVQNILNTNEDSWKNNQ